MEREGPPSCPTTRWALSINSNLNLNLSTPFMYTKLQVLGLWPVVVDLLSNNVKTKKGITKPKRGRVDEKHLFIRREEK
jgi:hypothetical protein